MKKALLAVMASVILYGSPVFALDPVVFVHGYSGSTIVNFSSMIAWFKADGIHRIICIIIPIIQFQVLLMVPIY